MKTICHALILMISLAPAAPVFAATPHELNEAGFWLEAKAQQLVRQSRVTMSDGTSGFKPGTMGDYPAFWTRDYAYMVEGCPEAFTKTELTNACLTFVKAISTFNGVQNTAAECVHTNGYIYHQPRWDNRGDNATGDNSQFTVDIAWRTYQVTKDPALLTTLVNNVQVIDKLVATMNSVPRSANGLVWIDPSKADDRAGYGFTDSVYKTGNELYCSLLDIRASKELADLLDVAGRTTEAATWRAAAATKTAAVQTTFWNPSNTASNPGLFYAATVKCHQYDVWGSALAVQLGVANTDQAASVANYFKNNYSTMVAGGQIREMPTTDGFWQYCDCGQGYNQNGGYWGVATGQYAAALKIVDDAKSKQTLLDMINFYKAKNNVSEFTNTGASADGAPGYVSSATLPLAEFKQYMTAQPVLKSMGGTQDAPKNLAAAANGGTAFAKDCISGFSAHSTDHLNDGVYGNSNSWIGNSQSNFAGVAFDEPCIIGSLAFGRDNGGEATTYLDRYQGTYIFQYTTTPNPNAATPDNQWTSFGAFYLDALFPNTTNETRHLYEFDAISGVTGVRILTCSDGADFASYTCIDEIEVYAAVPEPGTLAMAALGMIGVIAYAWRKRK